MPEKFITESSVARMAGNIAAGMVEPVGRQFEDNEFSEIARRSVKLARMIAKELERTKTDA